MKFTIVTPTYNSARFLSETIQSVLSQKGDFTIEHIIVDSRSQDDTAQIVKQYQRMLERGECNINCNGVALQFYQENDDSMYEAINYGFTKATGDLYGWINSDDIYLPGAFSVIARSIERYPEIKWIKGITSYINENSTIYETGQCFLYDQNWLNKGIYGRDAYFVQQDSVFWHSTLWKRAGGVDPRFKRAGDYFLWISFSRHAPLYTVKAYTSCFRKVEGQLSQNIDSYRKEYEMIPVTGQHAFLRKKIRIFFALNNKLHFLLWKKAFYRILFGKKNLLLIDLVDGGKPALKTVSYYVA
jgi:glycosyltransferase involved in cell wall biosynthesis